LHPAPRFVSAASAAKYPSLRVSTLLPSLLRPPPRFLHSGSGAHYHKRQSRSPPSGTAAPRTARRISVSRRVVPRPPSITPFPSHGGEGDRTPDLVNAIHALSQLSYAPVIFGRPHAPLRWEHGNLADAFRGVKRTAGTGEQLSVGGV